jgi:excinuclease ABC subunit A
VDMGPEGGNRGGYVVAEGTPEEVAAQPDSYTGQFLAPMLDRRVPAAASKPAKPRTGKRSATKSVAAKTAAAKSGGRKPSTAKTARTARKASAGR